MRRSGHHQERSSHSERRLRAHVRPQPGPSLSGALGWRGDEPRAAQHRVATDATATSHALDVMSRRDIRTAAAAGAVSCVPRLALAYSLGDRRHFDASRAHGHRFRSPLRTRKSLRPTGLT